MFSVHSRDENLLKGAKDRKHASTICPLEPHVTTGIICLKSPKTASLFHQLENHCPLYLEVFYANPQCIVCKPSQSHLILSHAHLAFFGSLAPADVATAITFFPRASIAFLMAFMVNVLLVPSGASKNNSLVRIIRFCFSHSSKS